MPPGIVTHYGVPLWDLLEHLIFQDYEIDGEEWHFVSVPGIVPGMHLDSARLDIYFSGIPSLGDSSQPSYVIDLIYHDDGLELWHGWLGATRHRAHRWTIGRWRQDLTEPLDWFEDASEFGTITQCRNLEEAHRAVEKELAQLCARLTRCAQFGRYRLSWAEMAAMLFHFQESWNSKLGNSGTCRLRTPEHGRPLVAELVLSDEVVFTLQTRREHAGWCVDVVRSQPYFMGVPDDCTWQGAVVIDGDYDMSQPYTRCPLRHQHREDSSSTAPWSLEAHIREEWYFWE